MPPPLSRFLSAGVAGGLLCLLTAPALFPGVCRADGARPLEEAASVLAPAIERLRQACGCDSFRVAWRDLPRLWAAASVLDSLRAEPESSATAAWAGAAGGRVVVRLCGREHGRYREFLLSGEPLCRGAAWVARHQLRAHVIVREGDVDRVSGWFAPAVVAGGGNPAVGLYTRRGVAGGSPIGRGDLGDPPLVRKGEALCVRYCSAGIRLEGRGVARRDGWEGDRMDFHVEGAARDGQGIVTGAGLVEVRSGGGER